MKKTINFRPLFYCFLALFGAILFAKHIFLSDWLAISIFTLIIIVISTLCLLRKKFKVLIAILIFIVLGFGLYTVDMFSFNVQTFQENSAIAARVDGTPTRSGAKQTAILENVSVNGEKLNEKIYLVQYGAPYLSAGDKVVVIATPKPISPLTKDEKVQSFYYKNGCAYTASASGDDVILIGNSKTFNETVQSSVKEKLLENMSEENAGVAFAMLFGDKSGLNAETKYNYQISGISHILAVSGLHVGILICAIVWLLKKLKSKNWITILIVSTLLVFYCYLCGFSASVVRASIMGICLLVSNSLGKRYDSLSAIGLAGLLILIFKPLYAFDVGFQLSFGCVIGIAIFYRSVYNFLRKPVKKFVLPNFLAKPLATTISAQFLILPVLISTFNGVSFFSIFLNIIIIPIFTVAFIVNLIATPLVFISGFFGNLFWFSNLLMNFIGEIASAVSSLSWSIIPNFKFAFSTFVCFFALMFICSRMFFAKRTTKILISLPIASCSALIIGLLQLS